ncbi:MAG: hypothetical protein F9K37_04305, partial [Bacteroidales bacterium]
MKIKRLLTTLALMVAFLLVGNVGWAQLIATDNFNYADNALLTSNGWVAHSGAGTAAIDVGASNGLSYTGYSGLTGKCSAIEGNAARIDNTGEDISKTFTPVTSGTIYYSFLVNIPVSTSAAGYFLHLGGSTSAFASRIYAKPSATAGKINFGISNTSTASYAATPTDFDPGVTYLIIVKYDVSTTGDGSLWVKASGVPITEVAAGTPEHTTTASGLASIDRICLRQYSATQSQIVDGIRIGQSWNDIFDFTAPTWTATYPSTSNLASTSVDLTVNADEPGTAFYVVLPNGATAPSSAQVVAGTDAADAPVTLKGNINIAAATTNYTANITGLTASTDYDIYVVARDDEGTPNLQASPTLVEITTPAPDVTAPAWTATYPKTANIANNDFDLLVNIDEIGKAYYVVLANGSTIPSSAQVKAGQDGTGAAAFKSGSINITTASTEFSTNING